jgi:16S rRNA (cytosine967-C5)-methyltransferase
MPCFIAVFSCPSGLSLLSISIALPHMSRYYSYLSSAVVIVQNYKGAEPFVYFIKKHFALHKKFGSKDRKMVSALCYHYFRTAHLLKDETTEQQIVKAIFLCEQKTHPLLAEMYPQLDEKMEWSVEDKFAFLNLEISAVFPFSRSLSAETDHEKFARSFLRQPLLYLRLRPGKKNEVLKKLNDADILFDVTSDNCVTLKNATSLDKVIRINKEAVVQDINSQKVFDLPENIFLVSSKEKKLRVWDCCAASGGKSILMHDKLKGNIQLTVSDIRKNILHNLQQRLQEAQVPVYKTFAADLVFGPPAEKEDRYDVIICDVPCTGSGTWSRTPEQLAFFKPESINEYAQKQQAIAGNAQLLLRPGGLLFYVTCSVFKKENEDNVAFLQKKYSLQLLQSQYYKGCEMQADTLFAAVFTK